jgi:poly-beta-1,6-N-acetyl-D-glucosamine synthase
MTTFFIIVFVPYSVGVLLLAFGWARLSDGARDQAPARQRYISIVIPFRNEVFSISPLMKSLHALAYSKEKFEVILVDDHSLDDSLIEVRKNLTGKFQVVQLPNGREGKKAALDFGIQRASGEVIVTTDADCQVPSEWLRKINQYFESDDVKMVVGPVRLQPDSLLFSNIQALEFSSLIGVTGASIGLANPTMCNGANLAFLKLAYQDVNGYTGNENIPSGDDEFLMRKIASRWKNSVRFLKDNHGLVTTSPQVSLGAFIQQRLRWASKWRHNSSSFTQFVALAMLFFNMCFVGFFCWFLFADLSWKIAASLWVFKMFVEMIFLFPISSFLTAKWSWLSFFALQFVYPFYVVFIGIISQMKGYQWKNRHWK